MNEEIPVVSPSGGRICTGEGTINSVRRGDTIYTRVGGDASHILADGRVYRVQEMTVIRLTPTRVRVRYQSGREGWRKHHELFLSRPAAAGHIGGLER